MLIIVDTKCHYAECRVDISLTTAKSFVAQAMEGVPQSEGFKNAANCRKKSVDGFNGKMRQGMPTEGQGSVLLASSLRQLVFVEKFKWYFQFEK
jgi:hypothetical protein